MTIEVNTVGSRCGGPNGGLSCVYCYLPLSDRINDPIKPLNHERIQEALLKEGGNFTLHGGEPLLSPLEDLEKLWAFGLRRWGKNGVQTSGRPITRDHLRLFLKYKVHVGFSIDGPEELNDPRWAGSTEKTRAATAHSIAMLKKCKELGISCGLIITLHRKNASAERLPRFLKWIQELDSLGFSGAILHVMEHDGPVKHLALSEDKSYEALIAVHELPTKHFKSNLFSDMLALLYGQDQWRNSGGEAGGVKCIWNACDPWTTPAVKGINPDGTRELCGRVQKDANVSWYPTKPGPLLRQLALRETPQEEGGCKGCRFMITCKGQCPGTAIDGDWRKRSRDCRTWYRLFEYFEKVVQATGVIPVTLHEKRDKVEEVMVSGWKQGRHVSVKEAIEIISGKRKGLQQGKGGRGHVDHDDHTDSDRPTIGGGQQWKTT